MRHLGRIRLAGVTGHRTAPRVGRRRLAAYDARCAAGSQVRWPP